MNKRKHKLKVGPWKRGWAAVLECVLAALVGLAYLAALGG